MIYLLIPALIYILFSWICAVNLLLLDTEPNYKYFLIKQNFFWILMLPLYFWIVLLFLIIFCVFLGLVNFLEWIYANENKT